MATPLRSKLQLKYGQYLDVLDAPADVQPELADLAGADPAADITRDHGWEALHAAGLQPVRQVAINETWSALRFRRRAPA